MIFGQGAIRCHPFIYDEIQGLMHKDVKLAMEEAEALGVPMWVGQPVRQWWSYALNRGGTGEDFTHLVRYMEEQAGDVEVRSRRNAPKE